MKKFEIDFFGLLFLAEVCIPPRPIARTMFFEDLSEIYYHQMTNQQRKQMYDFIKNKLPKDNEDAELFLARFNPENQYKVTVNYKGKKDVVLAYKLKDKFHVSKNSSLNENYILSYEKNNTTNREL